MYIIVNAKTNVIVGSAIKPLCEKDCSKNGQKVYEIPDDEYSDNMIGSILTGFDSEE